MAVGKRAPECMVKSSYVVCFFSFYMGFKTILLFENIGQLMFWIFIKRLSCFMLFEGVVLGWVVLSVSFSTNYSTNCLIARRQRRATAAPVLLATLGPLWSAIYVRRVVACVLFSVRSWQILGRFLASSWHCVSCWVASSIYKFISQILAKIHSKWRPKQWKICKNEARRVPKYIKNR